ncbi:hypothetical protein DFH28DRAFT_939438 [Melampsora americana]|nr:hypothetical protein DFH28DRAFT_939438 [Melampsora americana]
MPQPAQIHPYISPLVKSRLPGGLRSLDELDDMYDFRMEEDFNAPEDINETADITEARNAAGNSIVEKDMIMDEPPLAGMDMTHHGTCDLSFLTVCIFAPTLADLFVYWDW